MTGQNLDLPSITVVTCSLNQAKFLEETLKSVIGQNYPRLEYIVIDGGSVDGSLEIIRRYADHLAYWQSEKDNGQGHALAKGFDRATGDILCWLCSDDLLEDGALLEIGALFAKNPELMVVYGDTKFIDASGTVTRHYKSFPFNRWLFLNTNQYNPQPSTFWRREIYQAVGGVNPNTKIIPDGELFVRFSERAKLKYVRRTWSRMRIYPEIMSVTRAPEARRKLEELREGCYGKRSRAASAVARAAAKLVRISCRVAYGCYW